MEHRDCEPAAVSVAVRVMLDSGAYSCWKRGEELDLDQYIDYLLEHHEHLWAYVALDEIPGTPNVRPSRDEIIRAAEISYENTCRMVEAGLSPMPVFHQGEPFKYLDRLLDDGFDFVGISPANDRNTSEKRRWLDEVFAHLCGPHGYPEIKTHGLGFTTPNIALRYPWYSFDSITWLSAGGFGSIYIPYFVNGEPDYTKQGFILWISERQTKDPFSPKPEALDISKHFKGLDKKTQSHVLEFIERNGFTYEEVRDDYYPRQIICARFFDNVARGHPMRPFRGTLPLGHKPSGRGAAINEHGQCQVVFGVTTGKKHSELLTAEKMNTRLFSYYGAVLEGGINMTEYAKTGLIPERERRRPSRRKVKNERRTTA